MKVNTMRSEDRKIKKEMKDPKSFSSAVTYGAKSALNMTVLMWNDIMNRSNADMIAGEQARQRFDYKANEEMINEYETKIQDRSQVMNVYREKELDNREQFEAFYNTLDDNVFVKTRSQLVYGATSTLLNPIEFTKNLAINATINAMIPGAGFAGTSGKFVANMIVDSIDNYYSNTWEDRLLGLERETSEKIVQSVGGALISNAVFPVVSFGAKKAFNKISDGVVLKGKTINTDILEPAVSKQYQKELANVTAIDTSHRDFKIADSIKKAVIKEQPIEEGMERVFTKQEIKNNIILERTGFYPGIIDFQEGKKILLKHGEKIGKSTIEKKNKLRVKGKKIDTQKVSRTIPIPMGKSIEDWANTYIVSPYMVTKDGYKVELMKSMRDMHPMFSDTLGMTFKGQGYNDLLGEALPEKSVANSIIYQMQEGKQKAFSPINSENWDTNKLANYSFKKNNDFRRAIENGITYNVKENEALLINSPKYNKYFSNTDKIEVFSTEVDNAFKDWRNKELSYDELIRILSAKRARYESMPLKYYNGAEIKYKEFISASKNLVSSTEIDIDKLQNDLDLIKEEKVNTAIVKLVINKDEMLSDLKTKDINVLREELGEKIYLLKDIDDELKFDEKLTEKLHYDLTATTQSVGDIKRDLAQLSLEEQDLKRYDLIEFIKNNFKGETKQEQIENFLEFSESYKRSNWDMLNLMDKMIISEQAAMSTWGIPFKTLQDIIDDKGSFFDFFNAIPMFRKNFLEGINTVDEFTNNQGFKLMEPIIMEKIGNFVNSETLFPKDKQTNLFKIGAEGILGFSRWSLLFWSGVKETFQHPILAAIKMAKFGTNVFTALPVASASVVGTIYKTIEPLAATSAQVHRLYKGLGKLVVGDYADELALMELAVNSKMLFGLGEVNVLKKTKGILNNTSLFIQNSMQKNRYLASRILGINTISKYLKASSFDNLKPSAKKMFSSFGISDDIKFKEWQAEIKVDEKKGLKRALYEEGYSDITKKIHQILTRNSYEEDPISPLRSNTELNDMIAKVKLMFTNYNRSIMKYFGDALMYAELEDGTFINRTSSEAFFTNVKDFSKVGASGITLLSLAGLSGLYLNSKVFGDSRDEKMKAEMKAALDGNYNSMLGLAIDGLESAFPIDAFYSRKGGWSPVTSVFNNLKSAVLEKEYGKIVPDKLKQFFRMMSGNREYKKYRGMNKQEKILYDRLVMADKLTNKGIGDFLDYVFSKIATDELNKTGELTAIDILEIKRQNGYNDKEILEKLNNRGLEFVQEYSIINGNTEDEILQNIYNGIELIAENDLTEKEIVKELDSQNGFYNDEKEYSENKKNVILTPEEEEKIRKYTEELENQGYDALEIMEKVSVFRKQFYIEKSNLSIENERKISYN